MALTRDAIEKILGPVDNQLAAEVASTGASEEEVAKAFTWINADDALMNEGRHMPTGRVAEVIAILESAGTDDQIDA